MAPGHGRLKGSTLGDIAAGRDNNLNALRMIAASSVMFSHSYALTGHMLEEPLAVASGQRTDAATIGVVVFFAISGFLIAQSLSRRNSLYAYTVARALRILPGLAFAKLLCVFALGWYATTLATSAYFSHENTWKFLAVSPFFGIQDRLPGVFEANPYPRAVAGSLWTIPIETWCYTIAALLAALTILRRELASTVLVVLALVSYAIFPEAVRSLLPADGFGTIPGLMFTFLFGAWLHACRRFVPLSMTAALAVIALLFYCATTPLFRLLYYTAIAYAALVIAYHPKVQWRAYLRVGDYSYGTYLLAFPIQQFLAWRFGVREPLALFGLAFLATLPFAALSWHWIEKPMLALKTSVSAWRPRFVYTLRRTTRS